ncbi:MAG: ABC transporter ATP-binding protein [Clostridiaceae bacterium]|nr:ABC transporter ATP-binding protein [Clostridiaceae bacterium]
MPEVIRDPAPAIAMTGICKGFGIVQANRDIQFSVASGEIHALLGENGSGKSTLMNILSGIYQPDAGTIMIRGRQVAFHAPHDSIAEGIGMIHQHFKLVENLSAFENILAGTGRGLRLDRKAAAQRIRSYAERFEMDVALDKPVGQMSVGEKQTVEIMKVLYRGSDILVLDEPTAVLTPQEIQGLFKILRRMRGEGHAVIFISHKLSEVMDLCDRVTVLRRGQTVGTARVADVTTDQLVELMVGHSVDLSINRPHVKSDGLCLSVEHLSVHDTEGLAKLDDVGFDLWHGEILGVAGLAGSGQKELCEAIAGLVPDVHGSICFHQTEIIGKSPREIIRMGISMSFIPEDRLGMGLVASMDIADNIMLKDYAFHKGLFLDRKEARAKAKKIVEQLKISTPGIFHTVRKLSGGNIQKVILGREINLNPRLLITAYAVRGLDINSSYTIYQLINEQKMKGVAVLYIGEDLDVLLELCDRILVLCSGRVTGLVDARKTSKEQIGLMMAGEKSEQPLPWREEQTACGER